MNVFKGTLGPIIVQEAVKKAKVMFLMGPGELFLPKQALKEK